MPKIVTAIQPVSKGNLAIRRPVNMLNINLSEIKIVVVVVVVDGIVVCLKVTLINEHVDGKKQ